MTDRLDTSGLRRATPVPFELEQVVDLLLPDRPSDRLFEAALRQGLESLSPEQRRGALAGATGHIAESLVESLLVEAGWVPLHHFASGGVGVDLLVFDPDTDRLLAVEVKGTLRPGHWPRLRRGRLGQFTRAWLDDPRNVGMTSVGVEAQDVIGLVALVNFAERSYKLGVTTDFVAVSPVRDVLELA